MSLKACIEKAKDWARANSDLGLEPREIEDLGRLLQAAQDAGATPRERIQLMERAVQRRIEATQQAARGENYLNAIKNAQNSSNVLKNVDLWGGKPGDAVAAMEAQITGKSARSGSSVNQDPVAASRANYVRYMGFLENALSKPELKIFKGLLPGDPLTLKIDTELEALRLKKPLGTSGSDIALSIAKKFREAQDAVFNEAKAVNPYLSENHLYLFTRSHNQALVAKVTQDVWVKDAMAAFGKNLIGSSTDIDKFLGDTYKEIKSGLPPEGKDTTSRFWEPQGTGGSQAVRNAGQRVFVANDAKAEFDYNAKYGDSLYNSFMKQAQRQADYVATVNKWGTKPADNFQRLFNNVYRGVDTPEQKQMLLNNKDDLKAQFDATQATSSNAAWSIQGRLAQGLMAAENLSMLGNHGPRTLTSGPAMMAQLRDGYGLNLFDQATVAARTLGRLLENYKDAGVSVMKRIGVMPMSVARDMANQIAGGNGQPLGKVGEFSRLAGKLTLADYVTNAWKFAMASEDSYQLGKLSDTHFGDMQPQTQEMLRRYGLGDRNWEVVRHALDSDGRMTPEALRQVPDEIVNQISTGGKVNTTETMRLRGELVQNLGTFLNERASMTVGESNASSRYAAYGLSDINKADGIARNFLMQFKQVSITRGQLLQRTWRSGGGNTANISGTLQYLLQMAFAGAMGQQIVEMGAGREPLDMKDPKIVAHMIRSTGILGFYGDILADFVTAPDPDKMQRFMQGDMLGPSLSTLIKGGQDVFRTGRGVMQYAEGKTRENQYGGKQWAELIHSLTPGQNIFYAKGALDYTLFNEGHHFLGDNGYMGDLRRQMQQSKNLFGERQGNLLK